MDDKKGLLICIILLIICISGIYFCSYLLSEGYVNKSCSELCQDKNLKFGQDDDGWISKCCICLTETGSTVLINPYYGNYETENRCGGGII